MFIETASRYLALASLELAIWAQIGLELTVVSLLPDHRETGVYHQAWVDPTLKTN